MLRAGGRPDRLLPEEATRVGGMQETRLFNPVSREQRVAYVLHEVYRVLHEKGYDPVSQMVGYLLSGDPSYITREVRGLLRSVDRDLIIEELVRSYLSKSG